MTGEEPRVVEGFRLPSNSSLTRNELAWVEMLRVIVGGRDPPPTHAGVQALRKALLP